MIPARFIAVLIVFLLAGPPCNGSTAPDSAQGNATEKEPEPLPGAYRIKEAAPGIYGALTPEQREILISEAKKRSIKTKISGQKLPSDVKAALEARFLVERLLTEEGVFDTVLSEESLRRYYTWHRQLFIRPTQIRLVHVFFPYRSEMNPGGREEIQLKAEKHERLLSGTKDEVLQLCESLSREDPEGRRWGDLGYISRGTFPSEIELHLFALSQQRRTVKLDTEDGIHLFRLMDVRPRKEFRFDEVTDAVRDAAYLTAVLDNVARFTAKLAEPRSEGGND